MSPSLSSASSASPEQIIITQPDGTNFKAKIHGDELKAKIHGDEFHNWVEAEGSGHTVIRNHKNDNWEYEENTLLVLLTHHV
jgi:hypothetical protein